MIITVTPNPSVDRTFEIEQLTRGAVVRALRHHLDPGGKGINVARALHANGHPVTAVVPVGGLEGHQLIQLLDGTGLEVVTVPISGSVRSNVAIVEPDGTVTKFNEPGPALTQLELDSLAAVVAALASNARWVVISGSLPPGTSPSFLAQLVERCAHVGARTAVDTSGGALAAAIAAGPDLIKPNVDELAEATGAELRSVGDVLAAAHRLREAGAAAVLASLGKDGIVLVTDELEAHAELAVDTPNSSVGAGDAALAGYLGADAPLAGLQAAAAFGAGAVELPGSQLPGPEQLRLDEVQLHHPPDRDRPLESVVSTAHGALAP